jgi:predicted transcriptional regulator of viral defense system
MMNESLQRGCRHNNRMQQAYMMLPETFTIEDIEKAFGVKNDNAKKICQRLEKEGHLERVRRGEYKKISKTI